MVSRRLHIVSDSLGNNQLTLADRCDPTAPEASELFVVIAVSPGPAAKTAVAARGGILGDL
jgi:hypothetical protein